MGRSSTFPVFFRNAHLSACRQDWQSLPPSSHSSDTQRQLHRKTSFLSAILPRHSSPCLPLSLSLSHARSHTHSQASISILMDVPENMNVNKWETRSEEEKTSGDTEREGLGMSANLYVAFSWLTQTEALVDLSGPNLLGNTARPKGPNPSDWWIQGKSR